MKTSELKVVVVCPDRDSEKVLNAIASGGLSDAIAGYLCAEAETDHIAVEIK